MRWEPWFAFAMIALAVFVIYGLASSPSETTTYGPGETG
jgi:hypothetical protein